MYVYEAAVVVAASSYLWVLLSFTKRQTGMNLAVEY